MKYRTIVADPPWEFAWSGGAVGRKNGRGERHFNRQSSVRALPYPTMTLSSIAEIPVREFAEESAALFLWIPDRLLLQGIGAQIISAWGFEAPRLLIWEKTGYGLGTFPRPQHEVVIVAKRGRSPFRIRDVGSVHRWKVRYTPRGRSHGREHSAKPDGLLDLIERACPGPYLEMFARRQRLGWDTWGNEALEHVSLA